MRAGFSCPAGKGFSVEATHQEPQMAIFKAAVGMVWIFLLLYILAWAFGEHGHTYSLDPAKQVDAGWTCAHGGDGPYWDKGKERSPVCHIPVRQCPVLWLPFVTEVPCSYKDPLGGPYTEDDLLLLEQIRYRPR